MTLHAKIFDTEIATVLTAQLAEYGFQVRKEFWGTNAVGEWCYIIRGSTNN